MKGVAGRLALRTDAERRGRRPFRVPMTPRKNASIASELAVQASRLVTFTMVHRRLAALAHVELE
jgi:hypothetical protein